MLYVPLSDLKTHQLKPEDLGKPDSSDQTRALCKLYAQRAEENFSKAYACLAPENINQQMPNLVFGKLHQTLLRQFEKKHFDVFNTDIHLSPIKKLLISMFANPKKIVRQ